MLYLMTTNDYTSTTRFFIIIFVKVSDSCPVKSPKDHLLLSVGAEVYKVCPNPDVLLPYLIKHNPVLPVVYNQRLKIHVNTASEISFIIQT